MTKITLDNYMSPLVRELHYKAMKVMTNNTYFKDFSYCGYRSFSVGWSYQLDDRLKANPFEVKINKVKSLDKRR